MSKINEYLKNNSNKYPKDNGVIYRKDEEYIGITNKNIHKCVNSLVSYLKNKYKNVAIIGGNRIEWLISFWAVFGYVGNVIAIDKELKEENVIKLFEQVTPDLIIFDDDFNIVSEGNSVPVIMSVSNIIRIA